MGLCITILVIALIGAAGYISYEIGYDEGVTYGYSKGHSEGFTAGEVLQSNYMLCRLLEKDIANLDNYNCMSKQDIGLPFIDKDGSSKMWCISLRTDPRFGWDASWVYAGWECDKHRNEIVDLYREDHWNPYIK